MTLVLHIKRHSVGYNALLANAFFLQYNVNNHTLKGVCAIKSS